MTDEIKDALDRVKLELQKEREQRALDVLLRHMDGEQAELILEELIDERAV